MVTLLCPDSAARPASYISVVWLKLGMAIAGATTALETVRFTGLAWLLPVSLQEIQIAQLRQPVINLDTNLALAGTNVT